MSRTADTIYRQWLMLSKIPRFPRTISTVELNSILSAEGYDVDIRTVQRDLLKLEANFPLCFESEGRKHYWFWVKEAVTQDLPAMEPVTALTFEMAESYLTPILPKATLALLTPYFNRAKQILHGASSQLKNWPEKVVVIDRGPALIKPKIDPSIQQVIYQGLLEEKQIKAIYKPRSPKQSSEYLIHPLGIVNRHGVIYLVCTLWNYQDIKQLALHRFESAELLEESSTLLEGFNLASYVKNDHQFSYPINDEPIRLKVLFNVGAVEHLYETPLTEDQVLTIEEDGRVLLEGTTTDTLDLRWWLGGFESRAEILEPVELREHFAKQAQLLIKLYT